MERGVLLGDRADCRGLCIVPDQIVVPQIVVAVFSPAVGRWAQRWGRRPVLLIGFLGLALNFYATAMAQALWVLVAVRLVGGAFQANAAVAHAYVADISSPEDRARRFGLVGAMFGVGYVLGALLLVAVWRHKDFWTFDNHLASLGVGGLVVAMWWVSGHLGFVPEHPETLDAVYVATNSGRIEALTFTAPMAHTLDWLMFYSDQSKVLTAGVAAVVGVVMGSCVTALGSHTFRWEGFANPRDLAQHLIGAVLMGVGGVTAMGCTIGQGLSGISTLSLNALVALLAIVVGAVVALHQQAARLERTACG